MRSIYKFPEFLQTKLFNNWLFKRSVDSSIAENDEYVTMLEKALLLQIESAEDAQRFVMKYANRYGNELLNDGAGLVFAGQFEGRDIMVTPEVAKVLNYLNGEIKYLRGQPPTKRDLEGVAHVD